MEKGSIFILTIITVLILSLLVIGLLSVGTTEIQTTHNFYMSKVAYYEAIRGVETIVNQIRFATDGDEVTNIAIDEEEYKIESGRMSKHFIIGSLKNMQSGTQQNIEIFSGFDPPPIKAVGQQDGIRPVVWYIPVTSVVSIGEKKAFKEIQVGVYSILKTKY